MRVLVALGGNALSLKNEPITAQNQRKRVKQAVAPLAKIAEQHELIITHGNGPQVGLLAQQSLANLSSDQSNQSTKAPFPLDVLNAETEGMIGYLIEQELINQLPENRRTASLLTMVQVDANDKAFSEPDKPVGPSYPFEKKQSLEDKNNWSFKSKDNEWQRVVPSPEPEDILQSPAIETLLLNDTVVICSGGGGIPVSRSDNALIGVEAVIDKDKTSALLAIKLKVDRFIIATKTDGVYRNWQSKTSEKIKNITIKQLKSMQFESGTMAPKIAAAIRFVKQRQQPAVIGSLDELDKIMNFNAGTKIVC